MQHVASSYFNKKRIIFRTFEQCLSEEKEHNITFSLDKLNRSTRSDENKGKTQRQTHCLHMKIQITFVYSSCCCCCRLKSKIIVCFHIFTDVKKWYSLVDVLLPRMVFHLFLISHEQMSLIESSFFHSPLFIQFCLTFYCIHLCSDKTSNANTC